jgi:probable phosphomutase (TIGR03848 family)
VTILLLIRHAVTEVTGKRLSGATPDIHLSDEGRSQAAGLSERLAPLRLSGVYSSPLERCTETAEAIAAPRGLEVRELEDLTEVGYGTWTGRPLAQLSRTALWRRIQQAPSSVRFPGGETLSEVQLRCVAALDDLAPRHPRGMVAAVSHADVIRLAVAHYAGVHLDLFQRIIVSPASVTVIGLGDRIPRIIRMNDTGTLGDLAGPRRGGRPFRKGP